MNPQHQLLHNIGNQSDDQLQNNRISLDSAAFQESYHALQSVHRGPFHEKATKYDLLSPLTENKQASFCHFRPDLVFALDDLPPGPDNEPLRKFLLQQNLIHQNLHHTFHYFRASNAKHSQRIE